MTFHVLFENCMIDITLPLSFDLATKKTLDVGTSSSLRW